VAQGVGPEFKSQYHKKKEGNYQRDMVWWDKVEIGSREIVFLFPGALKTHTNLGEWNNLVIPNQ
jgi:hypothetical protein